MSVIPIGLRAERLSVLVVGAGSAGSRKALAFARAGASVRVVSLESTAELRDAAAAGVVRLELRPFIDDDIAGAQVIIAATSDGATNAAVANAARRAGRLVNRADDGDASDFVSMAAHHAGDITVGVTTDGVPAVAGALRDMIAERVDERFAAVAAQLKRIRDEMLVAGRGDDWRRLSSTIVSDNFCAKVESGTLRIEGAWR